MRQEIGISPDGGGEVRVILHRETKVADVVWRVGDEDQAIEHLHRSLEIANQSENHENQIFALVGEAKYRFQQHKQDRAAALLDEAMTVFDDWNQKQKPEERITAKSWDSMKGNVSFAFRLLRSALAATWDNSSAVGFDWPEDPKWDSHLRAKIDALRIRFDHSPKDEE